MTRSLTIEDTSESLNKYSELRRVREDVPWRLWVVAVIGFWERAAFWGLTAPWQNYMEHPLHRDAGQPAGALGLGQAMATRVYCAFYLFYYAAPILVAVVADRYLGRYVTLVASVVLYCLGCAILTMSSVTSNVEKGWGIPGLAVAMLLIGLGGGGFRAIAVPFIADQQTETKPRVMTLETGEVVVTDYQITLQYIYNLYYWVGNVGSLSWFATVYIETHAGFTAAYGLTLGFMVIAFIMLVSGREYYTRVPREQNALPEAFKIIVCACRSGFKMARADPSYQLEHRHRAVPWSAQLVAELTRGLEACRILLAFIMFYICFDQMQNNLISQAGQMQTNGTPNDLLPAMNQVGCIVLGPLIQEVLYPFLHRRRIYPTPVSRITVGFAFVSLSMLYATVVQLFIYRSPPCYDQPGSCGHNRINVWVQAPLYFLMSAGEIFAYVTALECAYDHSPKAMKVVVQAIGLLVGGVGSACAMALTPVAHNPYLVTFYASLTGGMAITTIVFWALFRRHDSSPACVETAADSSTAAFSGTQQNDACPAANRVSDEAPLLKPIDAGGPIELHSRIVHLSQTIQRQSRTASLPPSLPRKSSRRQRVDDRIGSVSRIAPSTSAVGLHGQLTSVPSRHFPSQSAGGLAVSEGRERRPVQSGLHRYCTSAIPPNDTAKCLDDKTLPRR